MIKYSYEKHRDIYKYHKGGKNKMKKFTVCLLIGAMAASMLTGCGGSNSKSENTQEAKADDDLTKLTCCAR